MMQALLEETFNLAPVRDRAASFRVGGAKEECVKKNFFFGGGGGGGGGMLVDSYSISLK